MSNDNHRGRVATTLLLTFAVLTAWAVVILRTGGGPAAALQFAQSLSAAGAFIALVVVVAWGPRDN
jgi:hypothetical protein